MRLSHRLLPLVRRRAALPDDRRTARGRFRALLAGGCHESRGYKPPGLLTKTYPEDPKGPDELLPVKRLAWPERSGVRFHYAHPVTGRSLNR